MTPQFWTAAETILQTKIPTFTPRPQQAQLATLMWEAATNRTHAAIEAPTGSGKTYAALIVADQLTNRTIISTATRALQAQIKNTDIPTLRNIGLLNQDTIVLEGRQNYACRQRLTKETTIVNATAKKTLKKVAKELDNTDGHRDTLTTPIPDWLWERIRSDSDACRANHCNPQNCAYLTLRAQARTAGIVIVNHNVLLADALIKRKNAVAWGKRTPTPDDKENPAILGPYRHLIVDEAHALEAAAETFGERKVSVRGIQNLAARISKHPYSGKVTTLLTTTAADLATIINTLPQGSLLEPADHGPILLHLADTVKQAAKHTRDIDTDEQTTEILTAACNSLAQKLTDIDSALRHGKDTIGHRAPSADKGTIMSQLIDAGPWLNDHLWDQVPATIISGTLTAPNKPHYTTQRIGLGNTPITTLTTVFNLQQQRLIHITPRADHGGGPRVNETDIAELKQLLQASNGRALVLFPATQDHKYTYDRLHGKTPHHILGQGVTPTDQQPTKKRRTTETTPMPNAHLAQQFHNNTHSVLLATRTFFEGVDFPGDTCSLVVIMRYPNLRPDDPLTLARRHQIENQGGNPWTDYQEPAMQLLFKQAAGRAIRTTTDKGVVSVLDPRSGTKAYAKRALQNLQPSHYTQNHHDIRTFLNTCETPKNLLPSKQEEQHPPTPKDTP